VQGDDEALLGLKKRQDRTKKGRAGAAVARRDHRDGAEGRERLGLTKTDAKRGEMVRKKQEVC
jgi:hypothetical protein